MDRRPPIHTRIGRIYDPLLPLAQRVLRAMSGSDKTIWTDANGYLFATAARSGETISAHAVIGTYGRATPRSEIESALRLALRERASRWIVDWKADLRGLPHRHVGLPRGLPSRRLRLSPAAKGRKAVMAPPDHFVADSDPKMA